MSNILATKMAFQNKLKRPRLDYTRRYTTILYDTVLQSECNKKTMIAWHSELIQAPYTQVKYRKLNWTWRHLSVLNGKGINL